MNLLDYGIVQYFKKPKTIIPEDSNTDIMDNIILLTILVYILAFLYIFISWRLDAKKEPKFPEAIFYPISLTKLLTLSILSFNIYLFYWFYRNYIYQKKRDNSSIMPVARGIFYSFWYYPIYASLEEDSKRRFDENRVLLKPLAILFAILFFASEIISSKEGIISLVAVIITPLFLIPLANYINYINTTTSKAYIYHSKWKLRHTFSVLIFIPLIIIVFGKEMSILPSETVVTGDKLIKYDIQYMHRKGIFPPNEKLLYFYSDAFLILRDDGNGFTQNNVFSYWKEDGKLYIKKANFNNIKKIDVIYAKTTSNNTTITITTKDNSSFILYISSVDALDKVFVKQLRYRWKEAKGLE
ncbi:MAG: hypothetical protein QM493_03970 [Sulfurovum sp.]